MTSNSSNSPASTDTLPLRTRPRGGLVVALLLSAVHFAALMLFFQPAIATPDASGYFAQGRHLATEARTWFELESPAQYVPPHWLSEDGQRYYSKYPPGLPLLAAGAFLIAGPTGALLVNPLFASLSVLGIFLVARRWWGPGWGLLAAGLLMTLPYFNHQALFSFSHPAVVGCLVWGLYFATRWAQSGSLGALFAAALLVGYIPTIRYAEVLLCAALGVYVLVELAQPVHAGRRGRAALVALIGGCLPGVVLAVRNHFAFGAFWRTGYAQTQEQTGFGLGYFIEHAVPYLVTLLDTGGGLLIGLGVVGLVGMVVTPGSRARGWLLTLIVVPTTLLYMAYYWPADGMSMRFLLPTLVGYVLASVWLLRTLAAGRPRLALATSLTVLLLTLVWGVPTSGQLLAQIQQMTGQVAQVAKVVEDKVPAGSVIVVTGEAQQQLDFLGRWRIADGRALTRTLGRAGRLGGGLDGGPDGMLPGDMGEVDGPRPMAGPPGGAEPMPIDEFVERIWQWAGPTGQVYCLADADTLADLDEYLNQADALELVQKIEPASFGPGLDAQRGPTARAGRRGPGIVQGQPGRGGRLGGPGLGRRGGRLGPPGGGMGPGAGPGGGMGPGGGPGLGGPGLGEDAGPMYLVKWRRPSQLAAGTGS